MSHNQRLLEGDVVESEDSTEVARLRELNRHLTDEMAAVQRENDELKRRLAKADGPLLRIRKVMSPFKQLIDTIYGELDDIPADASDGFASGPTMTVKSPVWESWKTRLPGAPAKIIDALLLHRDASVEQLVVLTQITRKQTIYDAIARLNKSGIIDKNGGRFSLKQL